VPCSSSSSSSNGSSAAGGGQLCPLRTAASSSSSRAIGTAVTTDRHGCCQLGQLPSGSKSLAAVAEFKPAAARVLLEGRRSQGGVSGYTCRLGQVPEAGRWEMAVWLSDVRCLFPHALVVKVHYALCRCHAFATCSPTSCTFVYVSIWPAVSASCNLICRALPQQVPTTLAPADNVLRGLKERV